MAIKDGVKAGDGHRFAAVPKPPWLRVGVPAALREVANALPPRETTISSKS